MKKDATKIIQLVLLMPPAIHVLASSILYRLGVELPKIPKDGEFVSRSKGFFVYLLHSYELWQYWALLVFTGILTIGLALFASSGRES